MTTLAKLEKRYDVLTADERFRLSVAARARGDFADERRLDEACPRVNLTGADRAYADRWTGFCDVAEGVSRVLLVLRERDRRAEVLRDAWMLTGRLMSRSAEWGWNAGWNARGGLPMPDYDPMGAGEWWEVNEGTPDGWAASVAAAEAERGPDPYLIELAAVWRAWDDWSLEILGLDGAAAFVGMFGVGDAPALAAWAVEAAERAGEPDPAEVAETRAAFDAIWRRRVGQG